MEPLKPWQVALLIFALFLLAVALVFFVAAHITDVWFENTRGAIPALAAGFLCCTLSGLVAGFTIQTVKAGM